MPSFIGFGALSDVKITFQASAIIPIGIMFIVTAIETVGDISACIEGGMDREATDSELSGGVICDGLGSLSRRCSVYCRILHSRRMWDWFL